MNRMKKLLALILTAALLCGNATAMAATQSYTVRKGDILWEIAKKYDVKWSDIADQNGVTNVRDLRIGKVLKIDADSKDSKGASAKTTAKPSKPVTKPSKKPAAKSSEETKTKPAKEPATKPSNDSSADSSTDTAAYTEYAVSIDNNGYKIPAIVCMPKKAGLFPAVVMLHGTGSDKNEAGGGYKLAAPELAKAGIASIRIDFVGSGESKEDYINYNFTSAVSDANAAAKYIAGLDEVDETRIGVLGWSQGGAIAMLAAGENRSFQSVVTWAGAPDLSGIGTKERYEIAKKDGFYNFTFEWRSPLKLGLKWFEDMYSTDVLKVLSYSDAPVLAVNGSADVVVAPSTADKIIASSKNKKSKAVIIESADHTYNLFTDNRKPFNKLVTLTVDWFTETLKPVYTSETVKIQNGERLVPATIVTPVGEGPFPAVVINHGHGGSREENGGFAGLAEALANQGIMSIRMDFPGCGESTEPFTENYLSNMISDSNACLDYMLANYNADKNNLGIFGYSMGGRLSLLIGSELNTPYKAMGLLAPAAANGNDMVVGIAGGQEKYNEYYKEASGPKGYVEHTTAYGQKQQLSRAWFDDLKASTPLKNISNFKGNILVVHGDKDNVVPVDVNEAVAAAANHGKKILVPGADHGYGFYSNQPDVTEVVEDSFAEFFAQNLK